MTKRALLSVSDKTGLVDFAKSLAAAGYELISTGGTAKALRDAGLAVADISDVTGFPEMLDGRVKTLHPKVHGGLLFLRDNDEHRKQAQAHGIEPIDLVVVNLYPFEQTIAKPGVTLEHAIENIDIGGPSMLRSAAKNYRSVTVVTDPADYAAVAGEISAHGDTTPATRERLAAKVFRATGYYDALIANYLAQRLPEPEAFPETFALPLRRAQALRYGENPHQTAALYGPFPRHFQQLHGKELSYNNLIDISAAVRLIREFIGENPTVAILKHTNPCGVGSAATLAEAWDKAYATDRQAPFGGIIVVNRPLDPATARLISEIFSEVIIAPAFEPDALALLSKKKNLRLMVNGETSAPPPGLEIRSTVGDSHLVQRGDADTVSDAEWKVVTKRAPTDAEREALLFGWRVVKHVKSNAIVYAARDRTLGIGAGQMSRIDSSRIAIWKASEAKLNLTGSIVASDAFFPFPDGLVAAAEAGATAAIQPGGSVSDAKVIAAADERGLAMIFTGRRHFRH
ncbi:MAG TPA: bifunctional phosphoribosylaminoimidazolecarboxamide formyltransferase/IMP cyclohydrolase [Candidatus Methylacidiphilales bacterium]|jgi:phosphoribosylaminoimidazolecarboxamide formyltransferase/IMP cyclohydrolase|nr:bifunctional phosphoribosylaminoimidazolecarboxamide formyltransferase/IMP cyclohydrolase [Candidatus Methylacidiphilales bacterium]